MELSFKMKVGRILKFLAFTLSTLVLLFASALLLIWFNLGWIVNEANIAKYKDRFLPKNSELTWDSLDLEILSRSWAKRDLELDARGLCFKWNSSTRISACFDRIDIELGVRLLPRPQLLVVRQVVAIDKEVRIETSETEADNQSSSSYADLYQLVFDYWIMAEEIINDYEFKQVHVEVDNFTIKTSAEEFEINVQSHFESPQKHLPLNVELKTASGAYQVTGEITFDIEAEGGTKSHGDINVKLKVSDKIISSRLVIEKPLYSRNAQLHTVTEVKKTSHPLLKLSLSSLLKEELISLEVESGDIYLPRPLRVIELQNCKVDIQVDENLTTNMNCIPLVKWTWKKSVSERLEKICDCKLPESLKVSLLVDGPLTLLTEKQSDKDIRAEVKVPDYKFRFLSMNVDGLIRLFKNKKGEFSIDPDIKADLSVKQFQALEEMLRGSPFAIPSPFHVFKGPASLKLKSNSKVGVSNFEALVSFDSNLKSPTQRFEVRADLKTEVSQNFKPPFVVKGDVLIDSVVLELPPFYPISGVPQVFKSPKIKDEVNLEKQKEDQPPMILYDLKVRTTSPNAIQLRSNLVEPLIPMSVDFHLKGKSRQGQIDLDQFTLESFKRQIVVQDLKLTLPQEENEAPHIKANLMAEQSGYTIYIDVIGKLGDVQIYMRSNPSLPRNDIISVLIYGRTFDNLAGTERDNVGNTGAAIADRAIGLFGIWLFASTPIQSVSYNPATKSYSAQVQVSDKTVLSVGTDWERVQTLELRRHLKGNWMIVTSYEPGETDSGKGSLVLQWQKFY